MRHENRVNGYYRKRRFCLKFTDYLSLMKIDTQWVIVHKTFYHEPLPE
ncbi:MAG: nuclear transport factor 2 family protein [Deltaproteobacteria bacterium]|nr:nuclear transport factor 2 family protein [Deltaproteobacteria bacterium]